MLESPSGCAYYTCCCWPISNDSRSEFGKLSACGFWSKRLVRLAPMYILTNVVGIVLAKALYPELLAETETRYGTLQLRLECQEMRFDSVGSIGAESEWPCPGS